MGWKIAKYVFILASGVTFGLAFWAFSTGSWLAGLLFVIAGFLWANNARLITGIISSLQRIKDADTRYEAAMKSIKAANDKIQNSLWEDRRN